MATGMPHGLPMRVPLHLGSCQEDIVDPRAGASEVIVCAQHPLLAVLVSPVGSVVIGMPLIRVARFPVHGGGVAIWTVREGLLVYIGIVGFAAVMCTSTSSLRRPLLSSLLPLCCVRFVGSDISALRSRVLLRSSGRGRTQLVGSPAVRGMGGWLWLLQGAGRYAGVDFLIAGNVISFSCGEP